MATSVTTSLPLWLTGCTYDADAGNDLRNSHVTATFFDSGIVSGSVIGVRSGVVGGAGLNVSAASGMTVSVQPGSFVVQNTGSPVSGGYQSTLPQSATLTVQTADPSNPRIDIVVANVVDNGNSTSFGEVQIITGTAAASPAPPAAPANSITLAQIAVASKATSIAAGNITDTRPFTTTTGGVLVAPKGSVTGYVGQLAYDKASGTFYHNSNAGGSRQARILPWPPAYATRNSDFGISSNGNTLLSVNITTDGFTDIKVTTHIVGLYQSSPSAAQVEFTVLIDGNQLDEIDLQTNSDDLAGISHSGFTSVYSTSSASGDTPSAGTHTVSWNTIGPTSPHGVFIRASATRNAYLRVEPVVL